MLACDCALGNRGTSSGRLISQFYAGYGSNKNGFHLPALAAALAARQVASLRFDFSGIHLLGAGGKLGFHIGKFSWQIILKYTQFSMLLCNHHDEKATMHYNMLQLVNNGLKN